MASSEVRFSGISKDKINPKPSKQYLESQKRSDSAMAFMVFGFAFRHIVRTIWRWILIAAQVVSLVFITIAAMNNRSSLIEPWFFAVVITFHFALLIASIIAWMGRSFLAITVFSVIVAVFCFIAPVYEIKDSENCIQVTCPQTVQPEGYRHYFLNMYGLEVKNGQ